MKIELSVTDNLTPALRKIANGLTDRTGLNRSAAAAVAVRTRRHFLDKNRTGVNRKNWPRQNFWTRFQNVTHTGDQETGTVFIPDPQRALAHKISGGTLRPKRGRALLIPLAAEAYTALSRSRARDAFPDAFILKTIKGAYLARPGPGKLQQGKLRILAKLVPSVTHSADPTALPAASVIEAEAVKGVSIYMRRLGLTQGGAR